MPHSKKHSLLKPPVEFDLGKVVEVYRFAMDLKGLKHQGLCKNAKPYQEQLESSIENTYQSPLTNFEESHSFIQNVSIEIAEQLKKVILDAKYCPGISQGPRLRIGSAMERITKIMDITMALALQQKQAEKELKVIRKFSEVNVRQKIRQFILGNQELGVLHKISSLNEHSHSKLKTTLVVAQSLGLDIGEIVSRNIQNERES